MNEFKKQLLAKIGDTTERKNRVIKRVNDSLDSKPQKGKKLAWGYYVTFASFVGIFILSLIILPTLMKEQAAINEEDPSVADPVTDPTDENSYYEELKQFFPPDGTVASFDVVDFYSEGSIVTTKWIGERYVLQINKAVNCPECNPDGKIMIYRITNEQIELISDGGESRTDWTVEELDQLPALYVELKAPIIVGTEFEGNKITKIEASISTPYGEFTNAVLVEDIEGYGQGIKDYNLIEYYVPGYGLVKSEVRSAHYSSSELVSISFGDDAADDYSEELKSYFFPEKNSQYSYSGGLEAMGMTVHTYWLSDQYVQKIQGHSDFGITESIYRINGNEIELVYEDMIVTFKPTTWTIEQLNELPKITTELRAPFKKDDEYFDAYGRKWTIIDTDGQVATTTYGEFSNVLILENIFDGEYPGRIRYYYAKSFGLVKWETEFLREDTRQYEVFITTELASTGQIMFELEQNEQSIFGVYEADHYNFADIDSDWELSPDGTKQATLVGRARDFEGINVLIVEDLETSKLTIYKYKDESKQYTPKDLEWIDDNRLYVIVGYGFGTVTRGGGLYELDLEDHSTTPIFEFSYPYKEEIMSIKANGDGTFTYQKHIYEDDELNFGHVEDGIISPN